MFISWKLQPQENVDFGINRIYIFLLLAVFSFSMFLFHLLPSSFSFIFPLFSVSFFLSISCAFINYRNIRCRKLLEGKLDGRKKFIAAYYSRLYFFLQFPCTTPRSMLDFRVALHFVQVLSLVTAVGSRTAEILFR